MSETTRYLCVHGHFYQPPRENPWLESVETQDSAAPYHDWNERITAECYAVNGASRILNVSGQIVDIVNNYAQISFNFGPTLLSWLEENAGRTYRSILKADRQSQERFGGHGSAMAQVYNHIIMPLASTRDKRRQIVWGIADFEHRFGRKPEGIWLAETAVDSETLALLAEYGIRFTVLAPHQCAAVRPLPEAAPAGSVAAEAVMPTADGAAPATKAAARPSVWRDTPDSSVDTHHPYEVRFADGRSIAVFFYDGPRSRAIAFEQLLNSGEGFAQRLAGGFSSPSPGEPELVHVATDGESYGHHHRYGEMALSYALQFTEEHGLATVINYGEFMEKFPPKWEACIAEETSWSCAHGVERWRSNCGCNGGRAGWNQMWRTPLREALDNLRDALAPMAAALGKRLFKDWEKACDAYIQVILDRSRQSAFLREHGAGTLRPSEEVEALRLLELERHAQLMYTSCGWFFDDISGIETVQIIAYAGRVLQLASQLFGPEGEDLEPAFLDTLEEAKSNVAAEGSGADIYRRRAKSLEVGLEQVAAHYAISSVFRTYPERAQLFAYEVTNCGEEVQNSGRGRLITGEVEVRSTLTRDHARLAYAVLHFSDQNVAAAVHRMQKNDRDAHRQFAEEARTAMLRADLPAVIRLFDQQFGSGTYTIRSLFADEERRVMNLILNNTVAEAEESLLRLYRDHASLLHFLSESAVPRPSALALAATFAINVTLRRALEKDPVDIAEVRAALELAERDRIELDIAELSFVADRRMRSAMAALSSQPGNHALLEASVAMAETLALLPFGANIWQAQNIWYEIELARHQSTPTPVADPERFLDLGRVLGISVDAMEASLATAAHA